MRTNILLDTLMPKTRQRVLAATILHPKKSWYLRELAEFLKVSPSSIQRELADLSTAGILHKKVDGNRAYFQAEQNCPIFLDLQELLKKTAGVADELLGYLNPLKDKILVAFIYGSIAAGTETAESDIDLLIIGSIGLADLAKIMKEAETKLGRPINPVIMSASEARRKLKEKQHFVSSVRKTKKLFLIGQEHELGKAFSR
jgi:predicted nucleotidyltransferase/DNA-binding transcriptional regulator YhcF (GntR family)